MSALSILHGVKSTAIIAVGFLFVAAGPLTAQDFLEWPHTIVPPRYNFESSWVDCDNDGDLDLFLSGIRPRPITQLYLNDGAGNFTQTSQNLGISGNMTWRDLDADGDLDLLITGQIVERDLGDSWWAGLTNAVYVNDGHGVFSHGLTLPGPWIACADVDNDGSQEILWHPQFNRHGFLNIVTANGRLALVAKDPGFGPTLYGVNTWKDFDRDGDVDALHTLPYAYGIPGRRLFRNEGSLCFSEVPLQASSSGNPPAWEDFDRDGYPDLLTSDISNPNRLALWRNDRMGSFVAASINITGIVSQAALADFDGDGDWDFLSPRTSDNHRLFRNVFPGLPGFSTVTHPFVPLAGSQPTWGDMDGDGDPDLLLVGGTVSGPAETVAMIYLNEMASNTRPSAPTGLRVVQTGASLLFQWDPATDAQTPAVAMTYELRIGRSPGTWDVVAPISHPLTGYRRVPEPGAILGTEWALRNYSAGTYYWTVQAIDTGFLSSPWAAEQQWTVTNTPPLVEVAREIRAAPSVWTEIPFAIGDLESAEDELSADVTSMNGSFLPPSNIEVVGNGAQRTIRIRPGVGQSGTNFVILTVRDPQGLATATLIRVISELFTPIPVLGAANLTDLIPLYVGWGYPEDPPVMDIDGDGDLDVLYIATFLSNNIQSAYHAVAVNGGQGNFTLTRLSGTLPAGGYGYWLHDFDRDGDVDILARGDEYGSYTIRMAANDGKGVFTPGPQLANTYATMLGDVDGDGDLDGLQLTELTLDYYENLNGQFRLRPGPLISLDAYAERGAARLTDIDGDGDLDFFIPTESPNPNERLLIRTLRNTGRARFTSEAYTILGSGNLYGIWSYDVNDDGKLDSSFWFSTSYTAPTVKGYALNDGAGHFLFSTNAAGDGLAGDFNNDGQPDRFIGELIGTEPVRVRYRLALKTGPGRYAPQSFAISDAGFAADFDGDGDLDLIAATEEKDEAGAVTSPRQLRFYRNNYETPNSPPPAPTGLVAIPRTDDRVTFQWNRATDDHTPVSGVSYNLRVGTSPGKGDMLAPHSNPLTGKRWLTGAGNAGTLNAHDVYALPPGTYYWSVQAIDGASLGSTWAPEQSITLQRPTISFIADVFTPPALDSQPVPFQVTGGSSPATALRISAVADDGLLIPTNGFRVTGTGTDRVLTITPSSFSGDTDVTLTATDTAGFSAVTRFHVRVSWWDPRSLPQTGIQRFEKWSWADVDVDGRLDLIGYAPIGTSQPLETSYRNLGGGQFLSVTSTLPYSLSYPLLLGDANGDNQVDVLTLENPAFSRFAFQIWNSTGNEFEFLPGSRTENQSQVNSHLWLDFDNDGIRDIVHHGWANPAPSNAPPWGVMMARGKRDGTFEYLPWRIDVYLLRSMVAGDFDADGDFDLVISGNQNAGSGTGPPFTRLYRNEGSGQFVPTTAGLPQDTTSRLSSVDFDLDGRLDLLLLATASTVNPRIMRNMGETFLSVGTNFPRELDLATWADYDNDGDPDLLAFTTTQIPSQGREFYQAAVFNNDLGVFTRADTGLPPIVAHQVDFADVDGDSDLDVLMSGESGWNTTGRLLALNTSPRRNQPPPAPFHLVSTPVVNAQLLEWAAPVDPESGPFLNYNLRVGTTPGGSEIISAVADPSTGQRRLTGSGNIGHAPRWRMLLPEGTYYWSVQAIDPSFASSPFAPEQVLVVSRPELTSISNIVLRPLTSSSPLAFNILNGTPPFQLRAESSDPLLIPPTPTGLALSGSGRAHHITVTPAVGRSGTANVTIFVTDAAGGQVSTSFAVTVLPALSYGTDLLSPPVGQGTLAWGDADRDGDLDLLVTGGRYDSGAFRASILRNDRTGTFTGALTELTEVSRGSGTWSDFDRDGDLDVLTTGVTESQNVSTTLYRNNNAAFSPVGSSQVRLPNLRDSAVAWADADGDGDLDVLIAGASSTGIPEAGLYLNDGNGAFSNALVVLPQVTLAAMAWADYDSDGDPDFVLTGSTNGSISGAVAGLYRNLGGARFEKTSVALPPIVHGVVAWADFEHNGVPDLFMAGASRNGSVALLLANNLGTFTVTDIGLPGGLSNPAVSWGDADLNSFPDLAISGQIGVDGPLMTRIFWNLGGWFLDSATPLPPLHLGALAWGDVNNDGLLDLAMAGSTNEAPTLFSGGTYSAVFQNNLPAGAAPAPSTPAGLAANVVGSTVTLTWQRPIGGDSYELRVGRTPGGSDVVTPAADLTTGFRRSAEHGQAGWSGRWVLQNLPNGTYYWSAQTVDAAYRGSPFAPEQSFTVVNVQPTISSIPAQTIPMNTALGPLTLVVDDPDGDESLLTISAVSSNPRVFPDGSIQISPGGAERTVIFNPAPNEGGSATIIFTVRDPGGGQASSSVRITVQSIVDVQAAFPEGRFSILEPADVDRDGDLDVLLAGTESTGPSSGRISVRMFVNSGDATFIETIPFSLPPVFDGAFATWGDIDADGDVDLFYDGVIYRNESGNLLVATSLLSGIRNGQAAWGDYDGDGDLDLAVTGDLGGVYLSQIYRQDPGGFNSINAPLQGLHYSSVTWGDPDADGDLDLALAGAASSNPTLSANGRFYRNDAGTFVDVASFFGVVNGKLSWSDINGDGRVDLTVTGNHGSSVINNLQLNLGSWEFAVLPLHSGGVNWVDTRFLDWDGDGDLDLLAGVNSIVAAYLNPGTGEFPSTAAASTSFRCRALRFGDYDGDADFDVLVSNIGTSGFLGQTRIYRNARIVIPSPGLPGAAVEGDAVTLRWSEMGPVNGAPVTYNVRVGTSPGAGNILSPLSRVDGRRLVAQGGNAGFATQFQLRRLPAGTYHWSVQSVDMGWQGGPWVSGGTFTITSQAAIRIVSFDVVDAAQARMNFVAPAGHTVTIQSSSDLLNWQGQGNVSVGVSGTSQTTVNTGGDRKFFRLNLSE